MLNYLVKSTTDLLKKRYPQNYIQNITEISSLSPAFFSFKSEYKVLHQIVVSTKMKQLGTKDLTKKNQ